MAALVVVFFICAYYFLKEKLTPTIPAENWANKELIDKDRAKGLSTKQIIRNVELGKYYIPKEITQAYPVPHRDATSHKIIIENSVLFESDVSHHGASQAYKWLDQGKYNLNREEMKIEDLRIRRKYAYDPKEKDKIDQLLLGCEIDWSNTEAARQWQKAYNAESKYH